MCPDVSQLCSTTKQYLIQSNCKNLSPLPPSFPLSLQHSFHPHQKLLIARQHSIIKTHVYTRVSFMDQDLEGKSRHMSTVSTMSSSKQPSSVSSRCYWNWVLCTFEEAKKTANNDAIQHVIALFLNRNGVPWRILKIGQTIGVEFNNKLTPWLLKGRIASSECGEHW